MKFLSVSIFIIFCVISNYASSKQYEYDGNCKFNGSIYDFDDCLNTELAIYDKELNKVYNENYKLFGDKDYKKTELLWVKFKEADCSYMAKNVNEGTGYKSIYAACLINKTKARIADLKRSYFYSKWFDPAR